MRQVSGGAALEWDTDKGHTPENKRKSSVANRGIDEELLQLFIHMNAQRERQRRMKIVEERTHAPRIKNANHEPPMDTSDA